MPRLRLDRTTKDDSGQASVELIAVVPALLLCALVAAQLGLAGQALWSAGVAARAGARAEHVGGDGTMAAKRALPGALRDGARVSPGPPVEVRVRVPSLIPGVPRFDVAAATSLEPDVES
jgi:pilus assembly protein CpaE